MPLVLSGDNGVSGNSGAIVSGTAVASTSGTSIDFTGIPSWVKRITVMFAGISVSGTANILFQLGSTTVAATGYTGGYVYINATAANSNTSTVGILMGNRAAAAAYTGAIVFTQISGNTWVGSLNYTDANAGFGGVSTGNITLSGVLDRVRVTTTNGTDTFDAGTINIIYE